MNFLSFDIIARARERARDIALDLLDAAAAATVQRQGRRICRWCLGDDHTAKCPIGIAVAALRGSAS